MITRETLVPHASHCSLDLVKLSFTAFVAPTSHFLHRRLISPSNGYFFPMPPGVRSHEVTCLKLFLEFFRHQTVLLLILTVSRM